MYKVIVIYHKLVSHEYFLDEMQMPDLNLMVKFLDYAEVASWQQTRQIMLCTLKPYLKKKDMTAENLFPLPTDDNPKEGLTTEISNDDVNWFKENKDKLSSLLK